MTAIDNAWKKAAEKAKWEREKRLIHQKYGLASFSRAFGFEPALHHLLLIEKLERAIYEPGYNLMISMPPGHAKSTYASVLFPAYVLGKFPNKSIIMVTHTQDFSDRWGRFCKRIITSPKYRYIFDVGLNKDSHAASRFDMENGSEYFGSGILGNITGNRADITLMDDLLRGIEDADSETIREKVWNAYVYDVKTRIKPGASKIIVATRWHEDDPIGRLLVSKDCKNWDVINLCALTETQEDVDNDLLGRGLDEALWPDYHTKESLVKEKESLDTKDMRQWNSLYQGKPINEAGNYFKRYWEQYVTYLPKNLDYYGASDYAVTDGRGDYTIHAIIGYDTHHDDIYIAHIWREQVESNVWIDELLYLVNDFKPMMWAEEKGQIMSSLDPYIRKMFQKPNQRYVMRQQFTSSAEKTARARSFQAYMSSGHVYILKAPWTDNLVKELRSFPSGKHDDQVDALALIGRMLNEMVKTIEKSPKKEEYEYKSGVIVLPDLSERLSLKKGSFKKF